MKLTKGFTAIELMIVVAVIGILATVAYPQYQRYVRETRRGDVQRAMEIARAAMEKFHAQCSSYRTPGNTTPPFGGSISACTGLGAFEYNTNPTAVYNVTVVTADARTYVITATPVGSQLADVECGVLFLDQANQRGQSGPNAAGRCWRR